MNAQGMPTSRISESRAKCKWMNEKLENKTAAIILETGQKKMDKIWTCNDKKTVAMGNPIEEKKSGNIRETAIGKGTAIIVDKRVKHQPCIERFNNDKNVLHMIHCKQKKEKKEHTIILGGIHTENGYSKKKWREIEG